MFEVKVFTNTYFYNMFQFHYLKVIFVGTTVIPNLLSPKSAWEGSKFGCVVGDLTSISGHYKKSKQLWTILVL